VTINILGANWAIIESSVRDDDRLHDCDGYCDWTTREIVVEREIQGTTWMLTLKRSNDTRSYMRFLSNAACANVRAKPTHGR